MWICPDCGMANIGDSEAEQVDCEVCGHRFPFWNVWVVPADVQNIEPIWSKEQVTK